MVKSKTANKDVFWWANSSPLNLQATPFETATLSVRNLRSRKAREQRGEVTVTPISEPEILHGACSDQRLLRVVQHMREGIHTNMEVCNVNTHSLLSHSRLISVTWGL